MPATIGQSVPRKDARSQISGDLTYGVDLSSDGMLFGKVYRSNLTHAIIQEIDITGAERYPGVLAVITGKDIPNNLWGFSHKDQPVLCDKVVRRFGDPIAVVAATSQKVAEEAIELIRVEYEPLSILLDPIRAMQADAPAIHKGGNIAGHMKIRFGNIDQGWKESDLIIEEEYRTQRVQHCHLEPHAVLVEIEASGKLIVHTGTQRVFRLKQDISSILNIPEENVIIESPAVGGGFGAKTEISLEPFACLLALKTNRPVKITYNREEEFALGPVRHPLIARYRSGVTKDGQIVARKVELIFDTGAYVAQGQSVMAKASINCVGPYEVPNVWVDSFLVYTNTNIGSAMRGFGVPQIAFAYESHTDRLAHELGIDPVEFRKKNFLKAGSILPTGQILEESMAVETLNAANMLIESWVSDKESRL
jgi:nicotinate dehydrogenase large molybdopterin subunit